MKMLKIAVLALVVMALPALAAPGPADLIGQPAPLFTGKLLDGTVVTLEDLRGRVVLLDFWAVWCPHCREALPKIQSVATRFANDPVTVLGVNLDDELSEADLKAFLARNNISFPQVPDRDGHLSVKYKVRGIPATVIIDKAGVVRGAHIGNAADLAEKLGAKVSDLLD